MEFSCKEEKLPSLEELWKRSSIKARTNLPDSNQNVCDYLYQSCKNNLSDVAIEYDPIYEVESTKITYRKLFQMIRAAARAYKQIGVKRGEIVTVCLPSFVESIVSFYALNLIGAVPSYIHPLASSEEIKYYLKETKSNTFISYSDNYNNFKDVVQELGIKNVIITSPLDALSLKVKLKLLLKGFKKNVDSYPEGYLKYQDFIRNGRKYFGKVRDVLLPTEMCAITRTSGTTGKSKGVMTSSFAFNEMTRQIAEETPNLFRGDKELLVLPPYPVYVICNNIHMCLSRGITVIVSPKVDYSNIHKYFVKYEINAIQAIPSIIDAMVNDLEFDKKNIDLGSLKFIVSGGGELTTRSKEDVTNFLRRHHSNINITVGYGLAEIGSCAVCTFGEKVKDGCVGRPLNDTKMMIVNKDTGKECTYCEPGEIYLTGPCLMNGYYNNEEETNKIFQVIKNNDGKNVTWLKTGDIGEINEKGYLKYVGRDKRKTMIVDLANNTVSKISNEYVEDLIVGNYKSGTVMDSVVISVPSVKSLNKLKAFILVKDFDTDPKQISFEINEKCEKALRKGTSPIEYIFMEGVDAPLVSVPLTKAMKKDFKVLEQYERNHNYSSQPEIISTENGCKIKIKARVRIKNSND